MASMQTDESSRGQPAWAAAILFDFAVSTRQSVVIISRNPGPLRIADLAGLLGDRVDPSQVPSKTRVMTRLLPIIPRARNDTTHGTVDPTNGSRVGSNYSPRHARYLSKESGGGA